jgi:hypothetical protein
MVSLIAAHHRRQRHPYRWHWTMLAVIFLGLAIDEICSLHEQMGQLLTTRGIDLDGALHFQWVVPGIILVFVVGLSYVPFLWSLPRVHALRFTAAGVMYIGGAIGVEMIGGSYVTSFGQSNLGFQAIATFEEAIEMTGVAMFLASLASYAGKTIPRVTLQFRLESDGRSGADQAETSQLEFPPPRIAA